MDNKNRINVFDNLGVFQNTDGTINFVYENADDALMDLYQELQATKFALDLIAEELKKIKQKNTRDEFYANTSCG